MRIILSAGHGDRDPGAGNPNLGLVEHLEAYKLAWLLRGRLESGGHSVEFISCFQSLKEKIAEANLLHSVKPYDLAIEIHFNSAVDVTANGTEVLYYSSKNQQLAAKISEMLSGAIGTKNRGAVKRDNLGWLKQTQPPSLIIEVLFIQNNSEASKLLTNGFHDRAAKAITAGLNA